MRECLFCLEDIDAGLFCAAKCRDQYEDLFGPVEEDDALIDDHDIAEEIA